MSVIPSPSVGDQVSGATFGAAVAAQLAAPDDQISFTPAGATAMTGAGTTTWLTLGNITVPAWAGSAIVSWTIGGLFDPGTTGNSTAVFKIGTATGNACRLLGPGLANQRFSFSYNDRIAAPPSGSQSITVQTTWTAGSLYTVDAQCRISAVFTYLP